MIDEIEKYHKKILNNPEVVPNGCYRRNSIYYGLICYINNIIGLYYASEIAGISVFIGRAYKQMDFLKAKNEDNFNYFNILMKYLFLMTKYIKSQGIDDHLVERLPEELKRNSI